MSSNGRTSTVMASRSGSHRSISPNRFANSPGSPASRWRRRWPFSDLQDEQRIRSDPRSTAGLHRPRDSISQLDVHRQGRRLRTCRRMEGRRRSWRHDRGHTAPSLRIDSRIHPDPRPHDGEGDGPFPIFKTNKEFAATLEAQQAFIARETRSRSLTFTDKAVASEHVVEWKDVDGHGVTIGVTPLHLSESIREFTRIPGLTMAKAMALFDAGYKSLAALRSATKQELLAVDGLDAGDVDRITEFLAVPEKKDAVCPTCQASVAADARRCPRCGEPMALEATPCPRCKSAIPPGADACPVCGFALIGQAAPGTPSRTPCVACGELILGGSSECPSCVARQKRPVPVVPGTTGEHGAQ